MKVVLDTNVLISGTFWSGDSYRILVLIAEGKLDCYVSSEIINEYIRILNSEEILEKTDEYQQAKIESIQKLVQKAILVKPIQKFNIIVDDLDDNKFIDCAIEGKVDYIITKDNHLLKLKDFQGIKIITPKDFLTIINT